MADHTRPPVPTLGAAALADASAVLARIADDERAAREERARLQEHGFVAIVPDAEIGPLLRTGEVLVAIHPAARVERIVASETVSFAGRLYLTSERLVLAGVRGLELALREIEELDVIGERVLARLTDGSGVRLDVAAPRVLRARIAFAMAVRR